MIMMMSASIPLLNLIAAVILISITFCHGINSNGKCIPSESEALLEFKRGLADPSKRLASWDGEVDCCSWDGVICNNFTGHVLELQLEATGRDGILEGNISESLLELKHLEYLDLSKNNFGGISIPKFFGFIATLRFLDLSEAGFKGLIPHQLGNLSNLQYLNLIDFYSEMYVDKLDWVSRLSSLECLGLSYVNLGKAIDWVESLGKLPSLQQLYLSNCQLTQIPRVSNLSLSSLYFLDLSSNYFDGLIIPGWISSLKSLANLDLSSCGFSGPIPISFGEMASLTSLDLSSNKLIGSIPLSFGEMASLTSLDLSSNKLSGSIPLSFGRLENLETLDLSFNSLEGIPMSFGRLSKLYDVDISFNSLEGEVSEIHFKNLSSLFRFDASGNHLILRVNSDWVPPFQDVEQLSLSSWDVGPDFPIWLRNLTNLGELHLSNSNISSTLPTWFHNFSSIIHTFDLSHNQMYGMIHDLSFNDIANFYLSSLDLSYNYFKGPLPPISSSPFWIDLSHNLFSGTLHNFLCNNFLCNIDSNLRVLLLKENLLHGEMPVDCLMSWTSLEVVELSNNNFSGNIPTSIGSLTNLKMLNLWNNSFTGDLPSTLQNCTGLIILDLGKNELKGEIPSWIGEHLERLMVLNFRGNKFHGHMSKELCNLTKLQILDVADNNLNGPIPTCVSNLMGMYRIITSADSLITITILIPVFLASTEMRSTEMGSYHYTYTPSSTVVRKGKMQEYSTILPLVQSLDLSNNNFVGDIPNEITSLLGLQSLNLSYNFLTGRIPKEIGAMVRLESLDLSQNRLVGEIPQSMSSMNFLCSLNFSNNNLSGQIPSSTQLQSLNASSFIGNNLCGPPLTNGCKTNGEMPPSTVIGHDNETGAVDWSYFYVSLAPGFVVGFWCVMGPLMFNKRWRISYFSFLELLWRKIWVWFHLHIVRFVRSHGF